MPYNQRMVVSTTHTQCFSFKAQIQREKLTFIFPLYNTWSRSPSLPRHLEVHGMFQSILQKVIQTISFVYYLISCKAATCSLTVYLVAITSTGHHFSCCLAIQPRVTNRNKFYHYSIKIHPFYVFLLIFPTWICQTYFVSVKLEEMQN